MNACMFSCQVCCHYRYGHTPADSAPRCEISQPGFPRVGDRCRSFLYNPRESPKLPPNRRPIEPGPGQRSEVW